MKNALNEQQRQEIINLYKSGLKSNTIAKIYNVHPNSILKLLNKYDLIKKPKQLIQTTQEQIKSTAVVPTVEVVQTAEEPSQAPISIELQIKETQEPIRTTTESTQTSFCFAQPIIQESSLEKQQVSFDEKSSSKFEAIFLLNNKPISTDFVKTLDDIQRKDLIDPIFDFVRREGWHYPDNTDDLTSEFERLKNYKPDLSVNTVNNNDSIATNICKFFCKKFFVATEENKPTMIDVFNDDKKLKKLIGNRLGLDWYSNPNNDETFNMSFRMLLQGMRSSRLVPAISIFKPSIAKYLYQKYSNDNDTIFDYSAGWGGRLLGAMSINRKYIGVDPWTTDELSNMVNFFKFTNATLINSGSENVRLNENSIDFSFSSPPYFNQEVYSKDKTQAYNNGEDYFYNVYWKNTLENSRFMLKPNKFFALNVKNYPKMVDMAINTFGPVVEEIAMKTLRSHLTKKSGTVKYEMTYVFKKT